jgi:predicted ribosome quality control (RQC) complex YloA/Tae2 family protein
MPLDAVFLSALVDELAKTIKGARIDKVQQPERDLLLLSLYKRMATDELLLSANSGAARLHFTNERLENPALRRCFACCFESTLSERGSKALPSPLMSAWR